MGSLGFKNIMSKPVYVTAYFRLILVLCIAAFNGVQLHAQNLKKANEIAQKLSVETDHEKRADLLLELCEAQGIGQIESALDHGSRALTIFQNIKNLNGEIRAYLTLGDLELLIGNYPLARSYFNKAYAISVELDDIHTQVRSKIRIGKTYINSLGKQMGVDHIQEAINKSIEEEDDFLLTECYVEMGSWHNHFAAYHTAIGYLEMALETARRTKDEELIANCLHGLGNGYLRSDQHDLAYEVFEQSLRKNESLDKKEKQAILCYELGILKREIGEEDEALVFFRNSLALATDVGLKDYISKGYQVLSEVYVKNQDYENAYRFLKLVNAIKGVSEISELETQIQNQKILRENQMLKQREDMRDEQDERKRERFTLLLVIVVLLCISMAYLFFVNQQKQKANNELEEAKTKAELSEKEKEKFLTYTSHEIRTPLNAVVGVAQLLEQTQLNQKQQDYITTIKGSANNILHIVNDVLDLSKIESGSIELESAELRLKDIINNIVTTMIFKIHNKDIKLIDDYDETIPKKLRGDSIRLNQIILNLTDNAVKFTRSGEIRIKAELVSESENEAVVRFEVSDTGKGIRQSSLRQIFNRYEQETIHTTRNYGGTGLGLPITKQLVELMGGKIAVNSIYGQGTTFEFSIAFKKFKGEPVKAKKEQIKNITILYVDDNQLNRELFYDLVHDGAKDVSVELAEDAKAAIRCIKRNRYDIILLDIQMPRMDGYELASYIRNKLGILKHQTPIFALTAYVPEDIDERCAEVGMNGYLTKPIDLEALNKALNRELKAQRKSTELNDELWVLKHVDLSGLRQLVNGDKSKVIKYLKISIQSIPEDLEAMKTHLDHEDWEMIGRTAHKMKSNASYMGMQKALDTLILLEKLKNNKGVYEEIGPEVEGLETESLLALAELKELLNNLES